MTGAICNVCASEHRTSIEAMMLSGVRVSQIIEDLQFGTNKTGLGPDTLYRHKRNHLFPSFSSTIADTTLNPLSLWAHLEASLQDASAVASRALATGSAALLLKATQTRVSVIRELFDRLPEGEGLDLIGAIRDANSLVNAVAKVTKYDPELSANLANELEAMGEAPEVRDALRQHALSAALALSNKENTAP